ncbi:MAG: SIR2 family protein [Gilvibacter sp.]
MEIELKSKAIEFLAQQLKNESLSLFLGAGISKSFDLDNWLSLLNKLNADPKIGLPELPDSKAHSADDFQNAANAIVRKLSGNEKDLIELISNHLYDGLDLESKSLDIFKHKQLISLSSLIMGNKRGRVKNVFTLNYDSLLEWYLKSFGFTVNTISELPYFSTGHDVEIFHPHGYIPHKVMGQASSKEIILSKSQADKRLGEVDSPWSSLVKHYLSKNVFLFIGMSEATAGDRMISPLLRNVRGKVDRELGIWIFKHDVKESVKDDLRDLKIAPLILKDDDEIPNFLLSISRKAMELSIA